MSIGATFSQTVNETVKQYNYWMTQLILLKDRMDQDPTLAAAAATAAQTSGRADLVTADFTNLGSAIGQLKFTYESGTPTQKSYLYKML